MLIGLQDFNDSKAIIRYSNNMDDVHKKILKNTIQIRIQNIDCI